MTSATFILTATAHLIEVTTPIKHRKSNILYWIALFRSVNLVDCSGYPRRNMSCSCGMAACPHIQHVRREINCPTTDDTFVKNRPSQRDTL